MKIAALAALVICASQLPAQQAPKPANDKPSEARPSFEIADVHMVHPRGRQIGQSVGIHGDRYSMNDVTVFDLIRTAYGFLPDKIYGGPAWLEMTRYDITAKVPPDTNADASRLMLQSLLEERFALKTHKEDKPLPTFALTLGKSPKLKEGDDSGGSGCKAQSAPGNVNAPGTIMFATRDGNGGTTTIRTSPDGIITYACRNVSMANFVTLMSSMVGANLGRNPLIDETGLKGLWSFDLNFSLTIVGPPGTDQGKRVTINDAVEKLGLKLEKRELPTPVLVVDSANETPTPNPPGIAEALPPITLPTEFEVASVKMVELAPGVPRAVRMNRISGNRFTYEGMPLSTLIQRAFNSTNREEVQGIPPLNIQERYDINARVNLPASINPNDPELTAGLLRNLLVDRFNLKYHKEQRPVTAYQLVAGKPKLKKADPANRTRCSQANGPAGSPAGTRELTCQNMTLKQFAEELTGMTPDLVWPVDDATGIQGNFDITVDYSFNATYNANVRPTAAAGGGGANSAAPDAADPTGGLTLVEAIEKQLGLKLEKIKRTEEVYVIDHIDTKPTEN
jgi:uncharacterized protein (TIGR03435 family)